MIELFEFSNNAATVFVNTLYVKLIRTDELVGGPRTVVVMVDGVTYYSKDDLRTTAEEIRRAQKS